MTDRRFLASNGRVALARLEGEVKAERFTEGDAMQIARTAWLRRAPDGPIDRQLLFGDPFLVLEIRRDHAFGISEKDGYVGYVDADRLWLGADAGHRVAVRSTWARAAPVFKREPMLDLHMNARVKVLGETSLWTEIATAQGSGFVPTNHLRPLGLRGDAVTEAHMMVGTPYVWGGNSGFGIDCSGLVQAAFMAAGLDCPPDSDLQQGLPGDQLDDFAALERGDLIFWTGHVAMMTDPVSAIHANVHHMAVAIEPLDEAIARIAETDVGQPVLRLRPKAAA